VGIMDKAKAAASKAKDVAELAAEKAKERADQKGAEAAASAAAAVTTPGVSTAAIFNGKSHDEGRNAEVTLFSDRIERVKERSRLSMSSAHQDVEITPIKAVSSVQAKKDGFRTKVTVYASGNTIVFRFDHAEAQRFSEAVMRLILNKDASAPAPAQAAPAQPDVYDQLKKLGELRDAGILSPEEFEAKKADLLGRL